MQLGSTLHVIYFINIAPACYMHNNLHITIHIILYNYRCIHFILLINIFTFYICFKLPVNFNLYISLQATLFNCLRAVTLIVTCHMSIF